MDAATESNLTGSPKRADGMPASREERQLRRLLCAAPKGYKMPDEPDGFDGHDYEGFPGGCERMNCKGTPCPSENQSRA